MLDSVLIWCLCCGFGFLFYGWGRRVVDIKVGIVIVWVVYYGGVFLVFGWWGRYCVWVWVKVVGGLYGIGMWWLICLKFYWFDGSEIFIIWKVVWWRFRLCGKLKVLIRLKVVFWIGNLSCGVLVLGS